MKIEHDGRTTEFFTLVADVQNLGRVMTRVVNGVGTFHKAVIPKGLEFRRIRRASPALDVIVVARGGYGREIAVGHASFNALLQQAAPREPTLEERLEAYGVDALEVLVSLDPTDAQIRAVAENPDPARAP